MATPTEAEIQDQIGKLVKVLDELDKFARLNAANWVGMEDAFTQVLETDFVAEVSAAVASTRSRLSGMVGDGVSLLTPEIQTYGKFLAAPDRTADAIIDRIFKRFIDASLSVNSRELSFGAPAAGGANVGNGTILRLNVDAYAFDLENQFAEAKRVECVQDQNSGAFKHQEVFEWRGANPPRDLLERELGSGTKTTISCLSANDSQADNPSFSRFSGTIGAPTDITSWVSSVAVVGDGSDYQIDQVNVYRDFQGDTVPSSLKIRLTRVLSQQPRLFGRTFDPKIPMMLQVAWNREVGGATGTLIVKFGNTSASVVVAAQAGWNILRLVLNKDLWLKNFDKDPLKVEIDWTRTAGDILVDDVLLVPGTLVDGGWYWAIGGSTPFLFNDVFTWTDTQVVAAKIQRWLWRVFGRYLPSNKLGTETWVDPA